MKRGIMGNEKGAYAVIFALILLVLLGFVALGIEAGRWYLVRAELSKSVDAAALAGANNVTEPNATQMAEDFGRENFQAGYIGTPGSGGTGEVRFSASVIGTNRVSVTGNVDALPVLAQLFGVTNVPVSAVGVAKKNKVEIMMILDRSGSMQGSKIAALKTAAISFLNNFQTTQAEDKVGLISFGATVKYEWDLQNNFVTAENIGKINAMVASGGTNMASALDAADGWTDRTTTVSGNVITSATGATHAGFSDQSTIPPSDRVQQFVVFFSDGQPTCFSGTFRYRGSDFDAAACATNNCRPWEASAIWPDLNKPNPGCEAATSGSAACGGSSYSLAINPSRPMPLPTGTGEIAPCCSGGSCLNNTIRWHLFGTRPVPGYTAQHCGIPQAQFNGFNGYMCSTARDFASLQAAALKAKGIKIYVIGLGLYNEIDPAYLQSLSSGSTFTYITPRLEQLKDIFDAIAKDIKLQLVE